MRNWLMDENMDAMIMERNMAIANEDIAVMTDLRPVVTPPVSTKETLVPADLIIGKYRSTLKNFKNKGYKIDIKELNDRQHETAFSIPCPDRKTEKNWVLDPIPLIKGK